MKGYGVKDNVLFQDNKSSILLEKNGKASSSKRTKHINTTELARKKCWWSGVLRETRLETTRPNHSRGLSSGSLETR
jgi:hypothetical protein